MGKDQAGLLWSVDEIVHFRGRVWVRGWAHHPRRRIRGVWLRFPDGRRVRARTGLASPDVAAVHGERAAGARFMFTSAAPPGRYADELVLVVRVGRRTVELQHLYLSRIDADPYHRLEAGFWSRLAALRSGAVLELGARDRSGNVRRSRVPAGVEYVGLDIHPGPNVDVVGDAHELSKIVPAGHFDAVFAVSVFEHLLMPWKAAIEINRVLKPGGIVLVGTHQSFPLHEVPWDFWRYSNDAWRSLFNDATGFAILDVAMGEPASVVPLVCHAITRDTPASEAYIAAGVVAQKTGETTLRWEVGVDEVLATPYPH